MNPAKLAQFRAEYEKQLDIAVRNHPEEYPWAETMTVHGNVAHNTQPAKTVHEVADKMMAAIEYGSYNHDGRAFKETCKVLGIKHTRKAINEFLNQE
jgi:hypothetical protein